MKKIVKIIVFIIVAALLLTLISSIPAFDDIKSDIKESLNISKDPVDSFDGEFKEKVFYNTAGDTVVEFENISGIQDGTRGFFVKGNNVFYCIKSSGHDSKAVSVDSEDLTYGGYEYCWYVTTDMITFTNYSDNFSATFSGDALIVYLAVSGLDMDDAIDLSDKLLANQPINIGYNDPPEIEGPGAS